MKPYHHVIDDILLQFLRNFGEVDIEEDFPVETCIQFILVDGKKVFDFQPKIAGTIEDISISSGWSLEEDFMALNLFILCLDLDDGIIFRKHSFYL